ncbi:MAG: hypothetical protein Phog2KO_31560 [Phototrophicaceae bacterium]
MRIISQLNISGPALQSVLLTAELQKMGYDCILVGSQGLNAEDSLEYIAEDYDINPILIPEFRYRYPWGAIPALWKLYKLMREIKPDIVHTHNPRGGFLGRLVARLAGVPVVVHTLHEYPFRGYYNQLSTIIFIYMERFGAYFSDSIITLSQSLRQALAETYGIARPSRITVLPLGFNLQSFAETKRHQGVFRQQWQIPDDVPLVGIIGRLLPVKNHRLFLESAVAVQKAIPNVCFVIVGDGVERENLEAYADKLGLSAHVIFTGWQQQMELVYSDLDVLVSSSLNEGTPVPIMEALSATCPVVATDVGGLADLLDNGTLGELVSSNDKEALSDAIIKTLKNPPDMAHAQETMLRRYGIQRLAEDLDGLYRGLLAKKSSH